MASRLKLTVNWSTRSLIISYRNAGSYKLPTFFQGDVVPIQIQFVEPNPNKGPNDFNILDVSSMAIRFGIGSTPTGTAGGPAPYITQYTWSKDTNENYVYANVAFNTAGVATAIGSAASTTAYLEIEVTEGSAVSTVIQELITIKAEVLEAASVEVAPGETSLSLEVAAQMFLKKHADPGDTLTMPSQDGTKITVLYTHDDGSWREESY